MAGSTLIARNSLHLELVPLLKDMIIEGELVPGEKIAEMQLCERFGVSRTPLREALKVLAAEGLIQITPNRGSVVAKITQEKIAELFPIMGMLEALAGELAVQNMTDRDLKLLTLLHETMQQHYENREWAGYIKKNREIHESIVEIAGNGQLSMYYHNIMIQIHSARYTARKSQSRWDEAMDDHNRLMAAFEARDAALAGAILREHIEHKAAMVRESNEAVQASEPRPSKSA